MVHLEKISENTFKKIINMKLAPGQEKFVASNVYSLAQAWLYPQNARPYAILNDDEPIGFLMLDWDEGVRTAGIWRLMIDVEKQHRGYGKMAMVCALDLIKQSQLFDVVYLDFVPANTLARDLYYSLGFKENGDMDDDEIVMMLPLTTKPKVGIAKADLDDLKELTELLEKDQKKGMVIPKLFKSENLKALIEKEELYVLTIMGKAIGLSDGNTIFISSSNDRYEVEAKKVVKKATKRNGNILW